MKKRTGILLSLPVILAACGGTDQNVSEPVSEIVLEILSDKSLPENRIVAASAARNATGSIFLAGEYGQTSALKKRILSIDVRDNVSGSYSPDGIADFAGETFFTLYDSFNSPYSGFFDNDKLEDFRELAVRHCIEALDTVYSISPYDQTGLARKESAKYIILNSAYYTAFGLDDAKKLFSSLGSQVEIITPLSCMLEDLMSVNKDSYRIAVISSEEIKNPEVYQTSFRKFCNSNSKAPSECFVFNSGRKYSPVFSLLDSYIKSGRMDPLDAILVDDMNVNHASIDADLSRISSVMDEASLKYGPLLSQDCKFIFASDIVAQRCYDFLRRTSSFRLMISKPQSTDCMTIKNWIIPYSENYLPLTGNVQD